MLENQFIQNFSNFLVFNFKRELGTNNVEDIVNSILDDSKIISKLLHEYGNISIAIYQYFKIALDVDITTYDEIVDKLITIISDGYSELRKHEVIYDKLEFNDKLAYIAKNFTAEECHISNNIIADNWKKRFYLKDITCNKLIIENWVNSSSYDLIGNDCNIKNLIISDNIDLIKLRNMLETLGQNSVIEEISYKQQTYNIEQFLNLIEQEKNKKREEAKNTCLYIVRKNKTTYGYYGGKKFYHYLFARKSKKTGKYRFASLTDMGSPGYSVVYFKSKEDAEKALAKSGYNFNYSTKSILRANLSYLDTIENFKEVETDYGINILIKKGSPADRYE